PKPSCNLDLPDEHAVADPEPHIHVIPLPLGADALGRKELLEPDLVVVVPGSTVRSKRPSAYEKAFLYPSKLAVRRPASPPALRPIRARGPARRRTAPAVSSESRPSGIWCASRRTYSC